jgi:hypothetical protein
VHGAEQRKADDAKPRPQQGERAETDEHGEEGYVTHHARFGEVTKIFFSLGLTLLLIDARQKLFFLIVTIAMSFALVTIKGIYRAVMTGQAGQAPSTVFSTSRSGQCRISLHFWGGGYVTPDAAAAQPRAGRIRVARSSLRPNLPGGGGGNVRRSPEGLAGQRSCLERDLNRLSRGRAILPSPYGTTARERQAGRQDPSALSANLTEDQIAKCPGAAKSLKSNDLSGLVRNLLCVSRVNQPSVLRGDRSYE